MIINVSGVFPPINPSYFDVQPVVKLHRFCGDGIVEQVGDGASSMWDAVAAVAEPR